MYVSETLRNVTEGYIFGDSEPQEAFTDDAGDLYRHCLKEFGRCTGHMYNDGVVDKDGVHAPIGWVFVKRVEYDDSDKTFLQEAWISLHDALPTRTTEHHYHQLPA